MAFLMASSVNDIAQLAPTPNSSLGDVLPLSVFTATSFFFNSTALSISHFTQPLLFVFLPTIQRKYVALFIFAEIALFIAAAFLLSIETSAE